jgi:hypothetical protein
MLIELARGITNATQMRELATSGGAAVVLTPKWDQRFESGFLQRRISYEPDSAGGEQAGDGL